jgi:hypothetical protein
VETAGSSETFYHLLFYLKYGGSRFLRISGSSSSFSLNMVAEGASEMLLHLFYLENGDGRFLRNINIYSSALKTAAAGHSKC